MRHEEEQLKYAVISTSDKTSKEKAFYKLKRPFFDKASVATALNPTDSPLNVAIVTASRDPLSLTLLPGDTRAARLNMSAPALT